MNNDQEMIGPMLGSWIVAALAGVLTMVLLMVLGGWMFMQGAFIGALVFVVTGVLIMWIMRPLPGPGENTPGASAAKAEPAKTAPPKPAAAAKSAVTASAALSGEAELSERKGEWTYEAEPKPAAKKPAAKKAAPAKKPVAADGKPDLYTAAQGEPDNLKLISGVGPKLEQTLNELGVWHFSQVASWRKKEVAWVDERLKFKGRIERDSWIAQAKILAKGGETEFSKRKKK